MADKVRVRFAPSPTGEPHIGNIRSAIFNWLFARNNNGEFVVRIEDTDQNRKTEGAVQLILEALEWIGLDWDEGPDVGGPFGPYYQSERLAYYRDAVETLLNLGKAYRCFCTTARLSTLRIKQQGQETMVTGYDGKCRQLTNDERKKRSDTGEPSVIRFSMTDAGTTAGSDIIHGTVTFQNQLLDDFIIIKSDGYPTYHLANVVDDHLMGITHVMRAVEWLSSLPKHLALYHALGWTPPEFAHLPLVLAVDRTKLSKRHGATSVREFQSMGILPSALFNYLALLGWSMDGSTEIFSKHELIDKFSLSRMNKSDAVFDIEKLIWLNGVHIRKSDPIDLATDLFDFWSGDLPEEFSFLPDIQFVNRIIQLVHGRMKTLTDAAPLLPYFFQDHVQYEREDLIQKGMDAMTTRDALKSASKGLSTLDPYNRDTLQDMLKPMAKDLNIKTGQLLGTLRVAITGLKVSPPIFETMDTLGRQRTVKSIQDAIERL